MRSVKIQAFRDDSPCVPQVTRASITKSETYRFGGGHMLLQHSVRPVALAVLGALSMSTVACGGNGGPAHALPVAAPTPTGTTPATPQIAFTSDRGVVLPGAGSTYQFKASVQTGGSVAPAAVTWTSSAPGAVSIDATGKATALLAIGSATITASSGTYDPQTATVIIAAPGPQTVLVASTDVLSASDTGAALAKNAVTASIAPGTIVVSGDKGGLLHRVLTAQSGGSTVMLTTTPASLPQAFPNMRVDVRGAHVRSQVTMAHGRMTLRAYDGRKTTDVRTRSLSCDGSTSLSGTTITGSPDSQLHVTFNAENAVVKTFAIVADTTVPIAMSTGSVNFSSGTVNVKCSGSLPSLVLPGVVPIGPVDIVGPIISQRIGFSVTGTAQQDGSVAGPDLDSTVTASDGVQYVNGAWQPVESHDVTKNMSPGPAKDRSAFSLQLRPFYHADAGILATLFFVPLAQVNFGFIDEGADFNVSVSEPLTPSDAGYTGPIWSGGLDFSAGPEFAVTSQSPISQLLTRFGVPIPSIQFTGYQTTWPLIGSPKVLATVAKALGSTCGVDLGAQVQDNNTVPLSYDGATVQFSTVSGPMAPATVATVNLSGTSARANWNVSAPGPYAVRALVFDKAFGAVNLPYPSEAQSVAGPACPTALLNDVHFNNTLGTNPTFAEGLFHFDPEARTIFGSTVFLTEGNPHGTFDLNDLGSSRIRFDDQGVEFVVATRLCPPCDGADVVLILPKLPTASGTYHLIYGTRAEVIMWDASGAHVQQPYMDKDGQLIISFPPTPSPQYDGRSTRRVQR